MNADSDPSARKDLCKFLNTHFFGSLGAWPFPVGTIRSERMNGTEAKVSPIRLGFFLGFVYAVVFCGLPYFFWHPPNDLFILSLWGSFYITFATTTARVTSAAIFHTLETAVVPNLSDTTAAKITVQLEKEYGGKRPYVTAYFGAAIAVIISGILIYHDLSPTAAATPFSFKLISTSPVPVDVLEIAYCLGGYFWLYVLSAKTTYMARFYGVFPRHLDNDNVYALSPAQSTYIKKIESIAKMILFFWFGILLSVGTLPVILIFTDLGYFVIVVVPVSSLFSFAFGTNVFLNFERCIRRRVNEEAASTLLKLEKDIADLFERRELLSPSEWERFGQLSSVHRALSTTAQHKSILIGTFSVVAPFVPLPVAVMAFWEKIGS